MKMTYSCLSVLALLSLLSISGLVLAQGKETDKRAAVELAPLVSFPADQPIVDMMPGVSSESQSKHSNDARLGTAQRSKRRATPPPPPSTPCKLCEMAAHGVHIPTIALVD